MIELNEKLGEIICPECKGEKQINRGVYGVVMCQKCQGKGKLDWCEQAVGVAPKTIKDYKTSFVKFSQDYLCEFKTTPVQEKMYDHLANQLADKIDAEIIESLIDDSEHNVNNKRIIGGSVYDHRVIS